MTVVITHFDNRSIKLEIGIIIYRTGNSTHTINHYHNKPIPHVFHRDQQVFSPPPFSRPFPNSPRFRGVRSDAFALINISPDPAPRYQQLSPAALVRTDSGVPSLVYDSAEAESDTPLLIALDSESEEKASHFNALLESMKVTFGPAVCRESALRSRFRSPHLRQNLSPFPQRSATSTTPKIPPSTTQKAKSRSHQALVLDGNHNPFPSALAPPPSANSFSPLIEKIVDLGIDSDTDTSSSTSNCALESSPSRTPTKPIWRNRDPTRRVRFAGGCAVRKNVQLPILCPKNQSRIPQNLIHHRRDNITDYDNNGFWRFARANRVKGEMERIPREVGMLEYAVDWNNLGKRIKGAVKRKDVQVVPEMIPDGENRRERNVREWEMMWEVRENGMSVEERRRLEAEKKRREFEKNEVAIVHGSIPEWCNIREKNSGAHEREGWGSSAEEKRESEADEQKKEFESLKRRKSDEGRKADGGTVL
ncbi:hypothetical protein GQ43DRAFT_493089 [Delitschia confertaspora ATCC 74209]|uniref:Uncharacterized protein n=1 Tax=Delitschia confertaspora ATCC 74209 TaxID=1513339 RepID=A0A9P4JLK1_9PLEO|nr:hypothetical protein GQ43DRAFT_493089 [Delitschia confertaspora ATCC 74209]